MSALQQAVSVDPWAEKQLRRMEDKMQRLEAENETLKAEYFLMRELIDLCATRNDDGDYLDPEFAFERATEIQKQLRDLSA